MRGLALLLLAGCNQLLGSNVAGPDDAMLDDGATDGDRIVDADPLEDGNAPVCAWSTPSPIAPRAARPSIAVGPAGSVHVVYEATDSSIAYLSRAPGMAWSAPLETTDRSHGLVAVDGTGGVHVLAEYDPSGELTYTFRSTQGQWSAPTYEYASGRSHVLAAGATGPVLATTADALWWARPTTSSWDLENVADINNIGTPPAIAISSAGDIHLLADGGRSENSQLVDTMIHAVRTITGSSWALTEIDAALGAGMFGDRVAIAVDGAQTAHYIYSLGATENTRHLTYRRRVANAVPAPRFQPDTAAIDGIAAVLDASAALHVLTHDIVANNLRYQTRSSMGAWSPAVAIFDEGSGGADVVVAIDTAGVLHMAWTDAQQRLLYTTRCL